MKKSSITMYPVNCGDAISLQFPSNGKDYTILVDGGFLHTYEDGFKPLIDQLANDKKKIDLWILTHLDADHINGAVSFLRDPAYIKKKIVKTFWFNCFKRFTLPQSTTKKSIKNGIEIRDQLNPIGTTLKTKIVEGKKQLFGGGTIEVLWPDKDTFDKLGKHWDEEEKAYWQKKTKSKKTVKVKKYDFDERIETLSAKKNPNEKKKDIVNKSSIAFIFELDGKRSLFLGDSHPADINKKLEVMHKKEKKRIKFEYVKLSHHASKANFDPELLDYIDCLNFIISANGVNGNKLPNKQTLAKILTHERRNVKKEQINFIFNYNDPKFHSMFDIDNDAQKRFNFTCTFPTKGARGITVDL